MSLLVELNPFISPNPSSPNYWAISAEKKLALGIYQKWLVELISMGLIKVTSVIWDLTS